MTLFGLTGGIGMGKSTVASLMTQRNIPVIDTDLLARQVVAPGTEALLKIQRHFGAAMVDGQGQLRRKALAEKVFAQPEARRVLEEITHPPVRKLWLEEVARYRERSAPQCVVAIPLLFETNATHLFDRLICVACSSTTQLQRLQNRGWTDDHIRLRNQAQWPIEKKMAAADHVIWSEGEPENLSEQLSRIL